MKRSGFLASILVAGALFSGSAQAQNVLCATRPAGDNSNACASTSFVDTAITAAGVTIGVSPITGGIDKAFFYNNAGFLGNLIQPGLDLRLSAVAPLIPNTVCTGSDDTATFQAAVNSSSAHGNTINVPALSCKSTATGISLINSTNVRIIGQGAGWGLDPSAGVSGINYTSATGSLFTLGGGVSSTSGIDLGNMRLSFSNVAYNGNLIELSAGASSSISEFITIHDCLLVGQSPAVSAASLINIDNTLSAIVNRCVFSGGAAYGIKGGTVTNIFHVADNFFNTGFTSGHVRTQGQAWLLNTNSFEPRSALVAGSVTVGGTTYGLSLISNGFQDATSGKYVDLTGGTVYGFNYLGNFASFTSGAAGIVADLGAAEGATIIGNYLGTATNTCAINAGSAQNVVAFGNKFSGATTLFCTTPVAGNNFYDLGGTNGWLLNSVLGITSYVMTANTSGDGLVLKNPTVPSAGNQQFSPRLRLTGQGWKTNATAGFQTVDFIMEVQPVQGAASPSANLITSSQINGGGYTALRTLFSSGGMNLGAPTGGDKGAGTLNVASNLYVNNVSVLVLGGAAGTPSSITLTNGTGLPTTGLTGTLQAAQEPAHTGDVTNSAGSLINTLANIPTGVPAAGTILHTNIAAPSSPAAGKVSVYSDSTDLRFHDKNASGVIGTTVVADTGASNQFLTAISAAGAVSKAQPSFSNLSGSVAAAQMPALTGACTTSAGAVATSCTINTTINGGGATNSILAGATGWVGVGLQCNATEAFCNLPQPQAATVSNFYIATNAAPGVGQTYTITMRKNASNQTVTCTISGGSANSCNDTTHSFTVAAADNITVQIATSGGAATVAVSNFSYKLVTTSP